MRSVRLTPEQEPFRQALEEALVDELYLRSRASLLGLVLVFPILWSALGAEVRASAHVTPIFAWLYAWVGLRGATVWLARKKSGFFQSVNVRHRLFAVGAICISLGLATLLAAVTPWLAASQLSLIALAYTGIAAIALVSMGGSPSIYFAYMLVMLTPITVAALLGKTHNAPHLFAPMLLLYVAALSVMALHEFRARRDNILLRLQVAEMALVDPLTQLRNRRFVQALMLTETEGVLRSFREPSGNRPSSARKVLWLLIVDLDHFKRANDAFGHEAGDFVLTQAATLLREAVRKEDVLARWGGEEFLVVARDLDPADGGAMLAERIRQRFSEHEFALPSGKKLTVTCSIGVASFPFLPFAPDDFGWEDTLAIADAALYRAKHEGRDCTFAVAAGEGWPRPDAHESIERGDRKRRALLEDVCGDLASAIERGLVFRLQDGRSSECTLRHPRETSFDQSASRKHG
jgi:diguanylate cyclase (GGDEF)-like protein